MNHLLGLVGDRSSEFLVREVFLRSLPDRISIVVAASTSGLRDLALEAIPVSDTSALSLARALLQNWVSRFGTPEHITSDRGSQFTSILWSQLSIVLGTELHHTPSYHPQANGMVERFHRGTKAALRSRLNGPNWVDEIPWVLIGLRTTPKEDIHTSAADMVYGDFGSRRFRVPFG